MQPPEPEQLLLKITGDGPEWPPLLAGNVRYLFTELPKTYLLASHLEPLGYATLFLTAKPKNDDPTKSVIEVPPTEKNSDGEYLQKWEVVDKPGLSDEEKITLLEEYLKKKRADIEKEMSKTVSEFLDTKAQSFDYDDIRSAVSYATSTHPTFGLEGVAFRDWRDQVWDCFYANFSEVNSTEEVVKLLPKFPLEK